MKKLPLSLACPVSALLIVFLLTSACGGDDDDDSGDSTENGDATSGSGEGDLQITATDNEFDSEGLTAAADTEVTLVMTNEGSALHNWAVPDEGVEMDLVSGGEEGETTFNLPAGEYEFTCEVHPEEMTGTLVVE